MEGFIGGIVGVILVELGKLAWGKYGDYKERRERMLQSAHDLQKALDDEFLRNVVFKDVKL